MSQRMAVSVVSGVLLLASFAAAQAPPAPQAPEAAPRFVSGAEVVALDLVVRDKKGKLVTDLQESEVQVLEDGVPQKLTSFRAIPGGGSRRRAPRRPRPPPRPRRRRSPAPRRSPPRPGGSCSSSAGSAPTVAGSRSPRATSSRASR